MGFTNWETYNLLLAKYHEENDSQYSMSDSMSRKNLINTQISCTKFI